MDADLEKAIDHAGRGLVFSIAEANGWPPGSTPPKWVWYNFVAQALDEQ